MHAVSRRAGRRFGARSRSAVVAAAPPTLLQQFIAAWDTTVQVNTVNQRTSFFEADYYGVDGVTGKVGTFIDRIDPTHALAQAVSAQQVAVPTADATMGGALTATYNNAHWYDSNRLPSAWRHQHSGIGYYTVGFVSQLATSKYIWATISTSDLVGKHGGIFLTSNTARIDRVYSNGATLLNLSLARAFTSGTAYTAGLSYLEGGSPEYEERYNGAATASGASTAGTPSTADPPFTLRFGAGPGGILPLTARVGFMLFAPFRPSAAQMTAANAYLLPKYGVTI